MLSSLEMLLIFIFPLCAFLVNSLLGKKLPRQGDWLSLIAIFLSFLLALKNFAHFMGVFSPDYFIGFRFPWLDLSSNFGGLVLNFGLFIDSTASIMLLMVTGVATLIHLFSTYYMEGEHNYGRFFTYLSLFTAAMLGLVLSDNLLSIFIFWELMGFCSYSLIGFYSEKEKAGNASLKAFMTTRVGDVFFLLGILALWMSVGSVQFQDLYNAIASGSLLQQELLGTNVATFAALCIFAGTIGKSAQFPLQVWLPDAMMGPTPCSALIHAATMVAAGVYLSLRMYPLMQLADITVFIAFIGAITAFIAASIALVQEDLKAVLAYSTISQLGYMVLGIGVGAYSATLMHLITHAVFKACLFLAAGSVIHALHDPKTHQGVQSLYKMGGLRKKLPITHLAMLLCTLSISGLPLLSGFVSKDRILGDALFWGQHAQHSWWSILPALLGFVTAFLTPFYMFRMYFLAFWGKPKDEEVYHHAHQEHFSVNRSVPLMILSLFTLGFIYSGAILPTGHLKVYSERYELFKVLVKPLDASKLSSIAPAEKAAYGEHTTGYYGPMGHSGHADAEHHLHQAHSTSAYISVALFLLALCLAYLFYARPRVAADAQGFRAAIIHFLQQKWFLDCIVTDSSSKASLSLARGTGWSDNILLDGVVVDGTSVLSRLISIIFRTLQSGKIQHYLILLLLGLMGYLLAVMQ